MRRKIVYILICMLLFATFAGAMSPQNTSKKSSDNEPVDRDYSHTILGEFGTTTFCIYCKYAHRALKEIFMNEWHPMYYITYVRNVNKHAYNRAKGELKQLVDPTVWWDGGFRKDTGSSSVPSAIADYNKSLVACGNRNVADIDLTLNATWLGAVNEDPEDNATLVPIEKEMSWKNSDIKIDVTVDNNEASSYGGHLHVQVCDNLSHMGWKDTFGDLYSMTFLDYAHNTDISISAGGTWSDSTIWDGTEHNNGTLSFENVTEHNTWVIATVFDGETDHAVQTATAESTDSTEQFFFFENLRILQFLKERGFFLRFFNLTENK